MPWTSANIRSFIDSVRRRFKRSEGYSQSELEDIQARWNLQFPPDLVDLLREYRPLFDGPGSFDWLLSDPASIQRRLDRPFDGFWFDVEHADLWWPEWGPRPASRAEQRDRLKEVFSRVPKLIPLVGHRYIPEEPFERGNPVFSVHQTDVIHYGANLEDWIERESGSLIEQPWPPLKEIPFWSEVVRRSGEPEFYQAGRLP